MGDGIAWAAAPRTAVMTSFWWMDPTTGPAEGLFNRSFFSGADILRPGGVFGTQSESPEAFVIAYAMVQLIREVFGHADPMYGWVPMYQRMVELDLRGRTGPVISTRTRGQRGGLRLRHLESALAARSLPGHSRIHRSADQPWLIQTSSPCSTGAAPSSWRRAAIPPAARWDSSGCPTTAPPPSDPEPASDQPPSVR